MICMLQFLLGPLIIGVSIANANSYHANTYGFMSIFDRHQPVVLLRTNVGIQMLIGNDTCYDNQSSIYYPSKDALLYLDYSVANNYLLMLTSNFMLCFKSLYKSDWNNAIGLNLNKDECHHLQWHDPKRKLALSSTRNLMYYVHENELHLFSLVEPLCDFFITKAEFGDVQTLHVTNFAPKWSDLLLVGTAEKVHILSAGGKYLNQIELDPADTLVTLASSADRCIFFGVNRANESSAVLASKVPLKVPQSLLTFSGSIISLSALNMTLAILVRAVSNEQLRLTVHSLHIVTWASCSGGEPISSTVYHCQTNDDLIQAIMVNGQYRLDEFSRNICHDNSSLCQVGGEDTRCDANRIFSLKPQLQLEEYDIVKEIETKTWLTCFLTIGALLAVLAQQLLDNVQRT